MTSVDAKTPRLPLLGLPMFRPLAFLVVALATTSAALAAEPAKLKVLFLGDKGHHKPADRFKQLEPPFAKRGIELVYTEKMEDLKGTGVHSTYAEHELSGDRAAKPSTG